MSNADESRKGRGDDETSPHRRVCLDKLEEALDSALDDAIAGQSTIMMRDGVPIVRFIPAEDVEK